jgi:hypothetical protein
MSNYLAVATVTAVLKELIEKSVQASGAISGAGPTFSVTTVRPSDRTNITKRGVNVFLHHMTPNAPARNNDLPTRRSSGTLVQRPTAAIDLHYVITFHGEESRWEPQRYYGVVLRTLHAHPTLSRELVKRAIDAIGAVANFAFIRESDLHRAVDQIRFTPAPLSLDELSKIWSSFYQTEYSLATVYTASPLLVEADETPQEALPVRVADVRTVTFAQPVIDRVRRATDEPITALTTIRIEGERLRGELTRVLLDDVQYTGALDVEHAVVTATLPGTMYAGVHRAQIVHLIGFGTPPTFHRGVESNVAPFLLHPIVNGGATISGRTARVVGTQTFVSGTLTIPLSPSVERTQRVLLLLNNRSAADGTAYSFTAAPRPDGPLDPIDTPSVAIAFTDVLAGTYYLRAQVDGATSVASPGPDFPTVAIT